MNPGREAILLISFIQKKLLSLDMKNHFRENINYNFIKVDLINKNYKNFFSKLFKIKYMSLKIKLILIFILSLIGINNI